MQRCHSFQLFSRLCRNLTFFVLTVSKLQLGKIGSLGADPARNCTAPRLGKCGCVMHAQAEIARARLERCDKGVLNSRPAAPENLNQLGSGRRTTFLNHAKVPAASRRADHEWGNVLS